MRVAPLVLVLALLALPTAAAQLPGVPETCGPISVPNDPAVPSQDVPAGGLVDVALEVANDGQVPVDVTVTAATTEPGWTIAAMPEPATIAAGGSATFRVTVQATQTASADAIVTFSADGTCQTPLPTCPPQACAATPVTAQVQIPFAPDEGFQIPGLSDLSFPIEYLVAAIVLVGLATAIPFAMRKKKGGIVADCPEPLKMVRPGRGTSFPIEIRNASKDAATAAFEVGPVPEGWSAFMPLPEVQLASREARSLWLMVRSPVNANVGDAVDVELRLRDPARGTNGTLVRVRAEVQGGAEP